MAWTNVEWARVFRLMQSVNALVTLYSADDDWCDAEIEKVGRKRVTLKQTYDTGNEMNPCVDRFETFEYAELDSVKFETWGA